MHTPLDASQTTGRRSLSNQKHVIESVLPEMVVEQIRASHFDDVIDCGFASFAYFAGSQVSTLKLTLTPSNACDAGPRAAPTFRRNSYFCRPLSASFRAAIAHFR
ncbi:hypothetical protein DSO57_1028967 [Entomophthora muscae]|uniref:Uncharacterized protein n=2 Tax=Entomophthora muscae TaxID=34485 RepID=A0ACC2TNH2_9FUNG|nr:hypothetical protein DSO57_1003492 [Entomophthora muscae]KAJ9076147.1 hypothetical protein DSO57_1028967 [Entomophthora muscae]